MSSHRNILFSFQISKKKPQENNIGLIRKTLRSQTTANQTQNKNTIASSTLQKKKTSSSGVLLLPSKTVSVVTNGTHRGVDKNAAKVTQTNSSRISDEFDEPSLYISAIDMLVYFENNFLSFHYGFSLFFYHLQIV